MFLKVILVWFKKHLIWKPSSYVYEDLFVSVCRIMDQGGLHDVCFVFVLSMYVSMSFVLFEFMRKRGVLFGD